MSQDWNNMRSMSPPEAVLTDPLTGEDKVALESKILILHALTYQINNYMQLRMRSFWVKFKRV